MKKVPNYYLFIILFEIFQLLYLLIILLTTHNSKWIWRIRALHLQSKT